MLEYISKQLQARANAENIDNSAIEEAQMNDAILECAHLVQELDDLSIEGTEADSTRPFTKIDIPLEDDIEITSVELNLLDGRATNIPGDATVQESDTIYIGMKTPQDFYQEAYASTSQYMRETDEEFATRVESIASKNYAAYKNYCIQEGLFGFDKLSVNDKRVPARVSVGFGKLNGKDYTVKLPVKFEIDNKNQILKKQLDSVIEFNNQVSRDAFMQGAAYAAFGDKVGVKSPEEIWSKVTPVEIVVPMKPSDKFCVAVGFELDGTGDDLQYIEWHASIKEKTDTGFSKKVETTTPSVGEIKKLHVTTKGEAIRQEAALIAAGYHAPDRFYQEAIDFGDPNEPPAADPNAASVSFDAPPADGMQQPADGDANAAPPAEGDASAPADGADAPPADGEAPAEGTDDKEIVDTNNVSDQIAEKVADETQNDAAAENDVNIDGMDVSDSEGEQPTEEELNADLGETPTEDSVESAPAETSDADFDNMTMDEMLAQGQEKMKGMTMQQIKAFLQGDYSTMAEAPPPSDEPAPDDTAEVQESVQIIIESVEKGGKNIKTRILNAMDEMQTGLKKIHTKLQSDTTKREIAHMWRSDKTSDSSSFGIGFSNLLTIGSENSIGMGAHLTSTETRTGNYFVESVKFVQAFVRTAIKKKGSKTGLSDADKSTLRQYYNDIKNMVKIVDKGAAYKAKGSYDVSFKQIDDAIMKVVNQYDTIKKIVSTEAASDAVIEEAFFLTRGNINKELDIHLRKALGILNSSELEIADLCSEFRKEGKKLNRVVHAASKMDKVYTEVERQQLIKLNHCVSDLMTMLRPNIDKNSIMTVKRMIQAFVAEASGVLKMVEAKSGRPVQEAAVSDSTDYDIKNGSKVPIDFFGQKYTVEISAGKMDDTQKKLVTDLISKSKSLFDNSVRKSINDLTKRWQSEMTDEEVKSIDWDHPEKYMTPKYIYVDRYNLPKQKWAIMLDCDWKFDQEHGIAVIFDSKLKLVTVAPAGNYL